MNIFSNIKEMQRYSDALRAKGMKIVCVPTMGYLHEGHLSLIRKAKEHGDIVVVTLFVNPTQFGPNEDFSQYPRNLAKDIELLKQEQTDILFVPSANEMYPQSFQSHIKVEIITTVFEGATRPDHFQGVTTVVGKLLNIVKPHAMVLGQKDAQQVAVLKQMIKDLNFDSEIVVSATVRDTDGLALSSRNTYLSEDERTEALALYRSLQVAKQMVASGVVDPEVVRTAVEEEITKNGAMQLDYAAVIDPETFEQPIRISHNKQTLVAVAAKIGNTRLIDNILLGSEAN